MVSSREAGETVKTKELADRLDVSVHTLRRWTTEDEYGHYLSPGAQPGGTQNPRNYDALDQRILYFVATLRDENIPPELIKERLDQEEQNGWQNLPPLPGDWSQGDQSVSMELAQAGAQHLASIAVLKNEIQHLESRLQAKDLDLQESQARLVAAESRVQELQQVLEDLRQAKAETEEQRLSIEREKHKVELDLAQAQAEVERRIRAAVSETEQQARQERSAIEAELAEARAKAANLEGRLSPYTYKGRLINPILLLLAAIVLSVLLVLLMLWTGTQLQ